MALIINDLVNYYQSQIELLSNNSILINTVEFLELNYGPFDQVFYKFNIIGKNKLKIADYISFKVDDLSIEGIVYGYENDYQTIIISSKKEVELSSQIKYELKRVNDSFSIKKMIEELTYLQKQPIAEKINKNQFLKSSEPVKYDIDIADINESQKSSILNSFNNDLLSIIHGPPGTGKTYTLASFIKLYKLENKKVLATAPTNVATDNIALACIHHGLNVTRIGVPEKIAPEIQASFIDFKIKNHKDYKVLDSGLKQMLKLKNKAFKYVRNLTPEIREERQNARKELQTLRKELRRFEKQIFNEIFEKSDVICSTPISSFSKILRDVKFDVVFLDEASQATVGLSSILWNKAPKLILAGDHKQLPPFVMNENKPHLFDQSFMDYAISNGKQSNLLKNQYRMEGNIMNFSNHKFYNDELINSTLDSISKNVLFIDTAGTGFYEEKDESSGSIYNVGEIEIVKKIIEVEDLNKHQLLIITPYSAQMLKMKKHLNDVKVNTIDSAQGSEADIVILSLTRSNEEGNIGFLKDYRRINVALTRAKKKIFVIGDSASISSDKFYQDYLAFIEEEGAYKSAFEYDIFE
jgi:ATP-dependent RNA/DNA helicase IGHMBP2